MFAFFQKNRRLPGYRRVRTPTVLQMEGAECGAASLCMVMRHYGLHLPLEQVRFEAGVSRDGSKAGNVLRAARQHHFEARGYKKGLAALKALEPPSILFWNFNHFVVLEGFSRKWVHLNDPACGRRRVTHQEFDESYTGIVLTFRPKSGFQAAGKRTHILSWLHHRLLPYRATVSFTALISLLMVVPAIAIPTFSKVFVDDILVAGSDNWLRPLLLGMILAGVLRILLSLLQQRYLLRLEQALTVRMSSTFLWHMLRLPVVFFTQRYDGEIASRVTLNDELAGMLSGDLASQMFNGLTAIFLVIVMFLYSPMMAAVASLFALLALGMLIMVSRYQTEMHQRLLHDRGRLIGTTTAGLTNLETLKASGDEDDFFVRWAGHHAAVIDGEQSRALMTQLLSAAPGLMTLLQTAAILTLGSLAVMAGDMTVGALVAFQSLTSSLMDPVTRLVGLGSRLQEIQGDALRVEDVLQHELDPEARHRLEAGAMDDQTLGDTRFSGHLELRNITFGYSRMEPPLLEGFDLVLEPGKRVALVGPSGCGKSTIAKLVCGLHQPWSGEVLLDGVSRRDLSQDMLRGAIGYVDQQIFLFEGTVAENLCLWDETLPEPQVLRGAKDAAIHHQISTRPGGYEGFVQEAGRNFSGGERQRMEIARVLAANPVLIVLDEATSALDPVTEKQIDLQLRRRGCSCLLVAHRLSTIRDCDEILVMEQGNVVERGTHDTLLELRGAYAALVREL